MIPILRAGDGAELARNLKPGGALTARAQGVEARFALPRLAGPILARIDGRRTLEQIHAALVADGTRLPWDGFKDEFDRLFAVFNAVNRMFLRRDAGG
jgi:hypothetical protein